MEPTPTTRTTRTWPYREAAKELAWLFTSGDAVMGYRAQSYEPTGGGWDVTRLHAAHMARLRESHHGDLEKHARVAGTFAQLSRCIRRELTLVYAPRQWPIFLASAVADYDQRLGSLVPLVLESEAVQVAFAARHKRPATSRSELVAFLELEATTDLRQFIFRPAVEEARRVRDAALEPYEALRAARAASVGRAKQDDLGWLRSGGAAS